MGEELPKSSLFSTPVRCAILALVSAGLAACALTANTTAPASAVTPGGARSTAAQPTATSAPPTEPPATPAPTATAIPSPSPIPLPTVAGFNNVVAVTGDELSTGPQLQNVLQTLSVASGGAGGDVCGFTDQQYADIDENAFAACGYPAGTLVRMEVQRPDGTLHTQNYVAEMGGPYTGVSDCLQRSQMLQTGEYTASLWVGDKLADTASFTVERAIVFDGITRSAFLYGCVDEVNIDEAALVYFVGFEPEETLTLYLYATSGSNQAEYGGGWTATMDASGSLAQWLPPLPALGAEGFVLYDTAATLAQRQAMSADALAASDPLDHFAGLRYLMFTGERLAQIERLGRLRSVPGGSIIIGADPAIDPQAEADEQPAHEVSISGFWMQAMEVSNAAYAACVEAGACPPPLADSSRTRPDYYGKPEYASYHPVIHVNWAQASAFCAWGGGRLPTEAEWELAARGVQGRKYVWGDDPPTEAALRLLNLTDTESPVLYPDETPEGIVHLASNVSEWVQDWYDPGYYARSPAVNPAGPESGAQRVARGGNFASSPADLRATDRQALDPERGYDTVGFRCVVPRQP